MDRDEARAFADTWLRAWNAHDVDAVLSHFAEDALFTSPVAAQLLPDTGGRLPGNHVGNLVNEVLHFDDAGLVNRGAGTYLAADAATASGTQG